jgi:small nuclear ribonucleoprotein (snRNP)-like protein
MEDPKSLPGWASSFDDLLDKRVLAILVDGRKIVGFLRSYDQFANIMIDEAWYDFLHISIHSSVSDI